MTKTISSLKLCQMKAIADAELESRLALIKKLHKKKQYTQLNDLLPICYSVQGGTPYIYTNVSPQGIFTLLWLTDYHSTGVTLWHSASFGPSKKSTVKNPELIINTVYKSFRIYDDLLSNHECIYRKNVNNVCIAYFPKTNQILKLYDRINDDNVSIDLELDRIQTPHTPYYLKDDWLDITVDEYMSLYSKVKAELTDIAVICERKLLEPV
jgi:hypothetical protein